MDGYQSPNIKKYILPLQASLQPGSESLSLKLDNE